MKKLKFIELLLSVAAAIIAAAKSIIKFIDHTKKKNRESKTVAAAA